MKERGVQYDAVEKHAGNNQTSHDLIFPPPSQSIRELLQDRHGRRHHRRVLSPNRFVRREKDHLRGQIAASLDRDR